MNSSELRKRFFDTAVADVLRAVDGGSLMGANTLALCVIDYLSYLRPKNSAEGIKVNYKSIVDEYLKKVDGRYDSAKIFALRCALVHTYAGADAMTKANVTGYLFKHKDFKFHLSGSDGVLCLNADSFVADVIWTAHLTFEENMSDAAFENRGDSLLVVSVPGAQMISRKYSSFHKALGEFDAANPDLANLHRAVTALYP